MAERHSGVQDAHPGLAFMDRSGPRWPEPPAGEPAEEGHADN